MSTSGTAKAATAAIFARILWEKNCTCRRIVYVNPFFYRAKVQWRKYSLPDRPNMSNYAWVHEVGTFCILYTAQRLNSSKIEELDAVMDAKSILYCPVVAMA